MSEGHAPLPTARPSEQGVDPKGILDLVDALEWAPAQEPHSLMILRHGHVIAQGWWAPYRPDGRQLLYSVSKSFTSTAAGLAVADGLLDLDRTAISYFPEYDADVTDPGARSILVRHLASMATGHTYDTAEEALARDPLNPVRGFLGLAPAAAPGTVFAYNQPATYTLAAIIQRQTGQRMLDYLRSRMLDRIGVAAAGWQQYPAGVDLGFTGLFATTDSVARLGQLYLQHGVWNGEQVLPGEWVDEATRPHIGTAEPFGGDGEPASPDWSEGYGFQFWMSRHGYRGDGAVGQFCLVLPEHDAVVAYSGQTADLQGTLDLVWRHLLPAFDRAGSEDAAAGAAGHSTGPAADGRGAAVDGAGAAADAQLRERLAGLRLPHPRIDGEPDDPERWRGARFTPAGGSFVAEPSLTEVLLRPAVEPAGPGPEWELVLVGVADEHAVPLGRDGWGVSAWPDEPADAVPLAACGGWETTTRLRADVVFLETPHRLRLSCDAEAGTFTGEWQTEPLRFLPTSLGDLHTPPPLG